MGNSDLTIQDKCKVCGDKGRYFKTFDMVLCVDCSEPFRRKDDGFT